MIKRIKGFLHYRTDLGDGIRTAVVFGDCGEGCREICAPFRFLPEHDFSEDTTEKTEYSEQELVSYLLEERTLYYTGKLGITFLGQEPLRDPFFCAIVAHELKKAGISLQVYTCGMCSRTALDIMDTLVDLYVLRIFSLRGSNQDPAMDQLAKQAEITLSFLESRHTPYRILVPVLQGINVDQSASLAERMTGLSELKSVILDFSRSELDPEAIKQYRGEFLKRKIILY